MALALALVAVGCGEHREDSGSGSKEANTAPVIPVAARTLVTAVTADWTATDAALRLYHRKDTKAAWELVRTWPGAIGKTGAAWGIGLHGSGAPAGRDGPTKHEGDARSPAGAFALRGSYGIAPTAPPTARLPYQAVTASWACVDDPASSHYGQILDRATTPPPIDWKSAESLQRTDARYTWIVDVAHNPERTPGAGSCIFLHVWAAPGRPTVGCTAMPEAELAGLLGELDPMAAPVFVLLPRAEYAALGPAWGLPPL